jgi:formamidopyrimidine-DNA glycosylase
VETVARGLKPLEGKRLAELQIFDAKVWFESRFPPSALRGLRLKEISRRGKYLLLRFENNFTLVQHLRMTGKMLEAGHTAIPLEVSAGMGKPAGKGLQLRCRFHFERADIVFYDTRRFGTLTLVDDEAAFFQEKKIAPDPLEDSERALAVFLERVRGTRKPAKAALLDQSVVAGVGNIYADEALFASGINPRLPGGRIPDPQALWREILRLLRRSIRLGGTTIYNYVNAEGQKGDFARLLQVYGREGEACGSCGTEIRKITLAGRSTHFCPHCQPSRLARSRPAVSM